MSIQTSATKRCNKCGEEKQATTQFFYKTQGGKALMGCCKACHQLRTNVATAKWYRSHPESIQAYRLKHREAHAIREAARRTRKRNLPNAFSRQQWRECLDYWNCHCVYCKNQAGLFWSTKLTADHWIALTDKRSDNPGTVVWNIVPACHSCNARKADKDPTQWVITTFGNRKGRKVIAEIERYFEHVRDNVQTTQTNQRNT